MGRYFVWFAPFLLLVAYDFLEAIVHRQSKWQRRVFVGILAALLLIMFSYRSFRYVMPDSQKHLAPQLRLLKRQLPPDSYVVSNIAVHIAWYCRVPAIDLPNDLTDLQKIIARYPVNAIFISKGVFRQLHIRPYWQNYYRNPLWPEQLAQKIAIARQVDLPQGVLFILRR